MVLTSMQKYGGSYAVTVPPKVYDDMPFVPDELIEIIVKEDRVILRKVR